MAKATESNVGEAGDSSIRIQGKRIEELDPVQQVEARKQLAARQLKDRRKGITDRYPPYKVDGLKAQLKQCEQNLASMRQVVAQEEGTIAEYKLWIKQCQARDKELEAQGFELR